VHSRRRLTIGNEYKSAVARRRGSKPREVRYSWVGG